MNCKVLTVEFRDGCSSHSPWHLDIAREYGVPLMVTSDCTPYVKIEDKIYHVRWRHMRFFYHISALKEMVEEGLISEDEARLEIREIEEGRNPEFHLEPDMADLDSFREYCKKYKEEHGI